MRSLLVVLLCAGAVRAELSVGFAETFEEGWYFYSIRTNPYSRVMNA